MNNSTMTRKFPDIIANALSIIFHPLFIPLYGLLIIFSAPTLFGYLPSEVKKFIILIVAIDNVLLPVSLLPYFRYRKYISSWVVNDRRERVLPMIITSFFYSVTVYIVFKFHIPFFIKSFIITAAVLSIITTIINFWWKISIHAVGTGALMALVIILSIRMQTPLPGFLIGAILSSGAVMSSRLWLGSHKPAEVYSGWLLGMVIPALLLFFA
jgi:hypothetical protein